jgi:universal stress protein A
LALLAFAAPTSKRVFSDTRDSEPGQSCAGGCLLTQTLRNHRQVRGTTRSNVESGVWHALCVWNSSSVMVYSPTHILVPVTFDSVSLAALKTAASIALASGARLHVLHVWIAPYAPRDLTRDNLPPPDGNLFERVRNECAVELSEFMVSAGIEPSTPNVAWSIHSGLPANEILAHCRALGCDWIVMGTHRHRGLTHWLLGSVAEEVLRHAPCPVLVVPGERKDDAT